MGEAKFTANLKNIQKQSNMLIKHLYSIGLPLVKYITPYSMQVV